MWMWLFCPLVPYSSLIHLSLAGFLIFHVVVFDLPLSINAMFASWFLHSVPHEQQFCAWSNCHSLKPTIWPCSLCELHILLSASMMNMFSHRQVLAVWLDSLHLWFPHLCSHFLCHLWDDSVGVALTVNFHSGPTFNHLFIAPQTNYCVIFHVILLHPLWCGSFHKQRCI